MKFFTDLLPILAFFIVYKKFDIFYATAAAIIITFLQVLYSYLTSKKVEKVQIINLVVILVFGGMTILFQNETFIKWKPSVLYWVFGTILIFSKIVLKINLIQKFLSKQVMLPTTDWDSLNVHWILFFLLMGFINIYIAYVYSLDTWVNFKLFGSTLLLIIFMIFQGIFIYKKGNIKERKKVGILKRRPAKLTFV